MKKLSFTAILIASAFWASLSFAQTAPVAEDIYTFSKSTETQPTVEVETSKVAVNTEDVAPSEDALLADAQTLIRDKLIEKYQVRLDKVMEQLTKKLAGVPAEVQRQALTDLQTRITEKKALVLVSKNVDTMKQEVILAILDHIILRIDELMWQSAQTTVTIPV